MQISQQTFKQQIYRICFKLIANWPGAPPALESASTAGGGDAQGVQAAAAALPGRRKGWGQVSEVSFKNLVPTRVSQWMLDAADPGVQLSLPLAPGSA